MPEYGPRRAPVAKTRRDWLGREYARIVDLNAAGPEAEAHSGPTEGGRLSLPMLVLAGVAGFALAVAGGFLLAPGQSDRRESAAAPAQAPTEPRAGLRVQVESSPDPALRVAVPAAPAAPLAQTRRAPAVAAGEVPAARAPVRVAAAPVQPRSSDRLAGSPSFDCRYARTPAERTICADPELAAADRRLDRAYRDAIASGIPQRELRREQDRWLVVREAAPDPVALAAVYDRRIAELQAMAR